MRERLTSEITKRLQATTARVVERAKRESLRLRGLQARPEAPAPGESAGPETQVGAGLRGLERRLDEIEIKHDPEPGERETIETIKALTGLQLLPEDPEDHEAPAPAS